MQKRHHLLCVGLIFLFPFFLGSHAAGSSPDVVRNFLKVEVSKATLHQGESFTLFVESANRLKALELECFNRKIPAFHIWHERHDHVFRTFIGVPHTLRPGKYRLYARGIDMNDEKLSMYVELRILKAPFKLQKINLPKKKRSLLNSDSLIREGKILGSRLKLQDRKVYFAKEFISPVKGRITSPFGARRRYNDGLFSSFHKGIDIAKRRGALIQASNGGRVSLAMPMKSNGNIVLINHGHGITTIYSHLDEILVKEGDWVKRGHIIGKMGSTGIANGPHLHFGFSVNNIRVDPLPWIENRIPLYYNPAEE